MDFSGKTCLVVSNPLYVSLAERLARDFSKVYLHVPYSGSFPTMNQGRVGYGLDNVTLVDEVYGPHLDNCDLVVFPDLYKAKQQIELEERGYNVWGNRNAEELEVKRETCKKLMEDLGLPVNPWSIVTGMTALREYLKGHDNQHVKIDRWRGVTETFFAPDYESIAVKLDDIEHALGGFKETLLFLCEDDLPDCVEVGIDTYCIDGLYPDNTLFGIEAKDCGYVGQMVKWGDIPEPLRRWNEALAPEFATYGCRGSISNEIRIGEDQVPYMVDATIRMPCPPGELWQEMFTNLSEIMYEGAQGRLVEPVARAKWGIEVILKSSWMPGQWQPIKVPDKFKDQLKVFNAVKTDQLYSVSQDDMTEVASVVAWGDTLEEAADNAKEVGESVEGYGLKFAMGSIDSVKKSIEELNSLGVSPFTNKGS